MKFELKSSDAAGWQELTPAPEFLIRRACIISLPAHFIIHPSSFILSRVTYTGGYVLPASTPMEGQTPLPADIESAAVEQLAFWFQHHDTLGLKTNWPKSGIYQQFATQDLLDTVTAVLAKYRRWTF